MFDYNNNSSNTVLLEFLSESHKKPSSFSNIICVLDNGSVLVYNIHNKKSDYFFSFHGDVRNHQPEFISGNSLELATRMKLGLSDFVAFSSATSVSCIYHFTPVKQQHLISAQLSHNKMFLMIYGMLHHDMPSFCVFRLSFLAPKETFQLSMIFADSILGVSAAAFTHNNACLYALPRTLNGVVAEFPLPVENFVHYQHRMISRISMSAGSIEKLSHMVVSPVSGSEFDLVTWSDEDFPEIAFWKFIDEDNFECLSFKFNSSVFIQNVAFNSTGKMLGLVVMAGFRNVICVWELNNVMENGIKQHNFVAAKFGDFINAKWGSSMSEYMQGNENKMPESYMAIGTSVIIEHVVNTLKLWNQTPSEMTNYIDINQLTRFYMNKNKELHVIDLADLDRKQGPTSINPEEYPPFSFLKTKVTGQTENATGMHLYRCCNCNNLLIHPLMSKSDDGSLEQCYCSRDCQRKHWPIYVTTQHPSIFDADFEYTHK